MDVNPYQSPSDAEPPPVEASASLRPRLLPFCVLALMSGGCFAVAYYLARPFLPFPHDWEAFWTTLVICMLAVSGSEFLHSDRWESLTSSRRIPLSVVAMFVATILGATVFQSLDLDYPRHSSYPYAAARFGILMGMFALVIAILRLGLWHLGRPLRKPQSRDKWDQV
jgi:hypothetical protein